MSPDGSGVQVPVMDMEGQWTTVLTGPDEPPRVLLSPSGRLGQENFSEFLHSGNVFDEQGFVSRERQRRPNER